ncbi:MAG TPA: ATP-dependent metallopeptidase FtsH/Yme1/Tma family protein, partial [Polyangiaceae bacterium]|nr:ATP-dependent metallopeptidase FtsH/Yme1/Tma family protein [Polyangiaceae bacterium]
MRQPHKTLLLWVVLIVAFLAIWQFLNDQDGPQRSEMPYSEFIALVKAPRDQRHIEAVEIRDRDYTFTVKNPAGKGAEEHGRTVGPSEDNASDLLSHGVSVKFQKDEGGSFLTPLLTILLPMLFVIVM